MDRILTRLDEYLAQNDYDAAERHLLYWLAEKRGSSAAVGLYNELLGIYRKTGQEEKALESVKNALQMIEDLKLDGGIAAATTYLNAATVLHAFGRAEEGLPLFERAREIYERELPPADDRLGGLYNNMGLALVDLKRFREAETIYQKALSVMAQTPDKEPELAITYLNMATAVEMEHGMDHPLIPALAQKARECMDIGKYRTDGNYAFVCEKCATVFGYYGFEDYARELQARCGRIYEGT